MKEKLKKAKETKTNKKSNITPSISQSSGITLVALIITIIVLLILAVVAIRAVQGDGIIQHARNATAAYSEKQEEEEDMLSEYELILAQETGKAWKQDKTKVTKGNITLEVGDTVNYDETKGGTVTVPVDVEWKVLGEENGQILLMSTAYVTRDEDPLYLYPTDCYNNIGIGKMNNACSAYGQGNGATGARSIKAEDIDRITGYDKTTYGIGQIEQYGNIVTYTLGKDGDIVTVTVEGKPNLTSTFSITDDFGGSFYKPDGTELQAGESYTADQNTFYSYKGETYLSTTSEAYKMLFNGSSYTLASFYAYNRFDGTYYGGLGVHCVASGSIVGDDICNAHAGDIVPARVVARGSFSKIRC